MARAPKPRGAGGPRSWPRCRPARLRRRPEPGPRPCCPLPAQLYRPSDDAAELVRLAATGEGPALEFKRRVPRPARLAKEVVAFANTRAGACSMGVDDDGTVVGPARTPRRRSSPSAKPSTRSCDPPVAYTIDRVDSGPHARRAGVRVPPSPARPHYRGGATDEAAAGLYVRVGASSVEASREAVRLMRQPALGRRAGSASSSARRRACSCATSTPTGASPWRCSRRSRALAPKQASHTLVLLTRAGLLRHHVALPEDYFTRAFAA